MLKKVIEEKEQLKGELEQERQRNFQLQQYLSEIQEWKEQLIAHIEVAPKSPH